MLVSALAEIYMDIAPANYSRTGRNIVIASENPGDPDEGILVNVPFYRDPNTGEPVPVPGGNPGDIITLQEDAGDGQPHTEEVRLFNPQEAKVKVETYSSGQRRAGAGTKTEALMQMIPAAEGPLRVVFLKSAVKSLQQVVPMDDVVEAMDAGAPDPVARGATNTKSLLPRLAAATAERDQYKHQFEQAAQAADQLNKAGEIEQMKAAARAQMEEMKVTIKAATDEQIARLKAEIEREKIEAGREKVLIENAGKTANQADKAEQDAALEGVKSALKDKD